MIATSISAAQPSPAEPRLGSGSGLRAAAAELVAAGYSVVPMERKGSDKRPRLASWTEYRTRQPNSDELDRWFSGGNGSVAIVCGAASGGLEVIDFDCAGEAFDAWWCQVLTALPDVAPRLVVQRTPSGGLHVVYRTPVSVGPSVKLARKLISTTEDHVTVAGRRHQTTESPEGHRQAFVTLIETRGEGGLAICSPSPGYAIAQGQLAMPPMLTDSERDELLSIAREFDEGPPDTEGFVLAGPQAGVARRDEAELRPGDDFNLRGDAREVLVRHGWTRLRAGPNEHWCRPGKTRGTSATFNGTHFFVFSTNALPLQAGRAYSPFALVATLDHGGDFSHAARTLRQRGFGDAMRSGTSSTTDGPLSRGGFDVLTASELTTRATALREPIVEGLLRVGEIANLVAAPKSGKSWAAMDLAVAVSTGRRFLDHFATRRNPVLLVDNELHEATISHRLTAVIAASGLSQDGCGEFLNIVCARESPRQQRPLSAVADAVRRTGSRLVILDAWYRFLPGDMDENDNLRVTRVYDELNDIAREHGCAIVIVHHTSKGDQWSKSVSDLGAGAGSQSRACDAHIALRPLREDGTSALHAIVRSWPPVPPLGLRYQFPRWIADPAIDPASTTGRASPKPDRRSVAWTVESFVRRFVTEAPIGRSELQQNARAEGVSTRAFTRLVGAAVSGGYAHVWKTASNQEDRFATVPQPAER